MTEEIEIYYNEIIRAFLEIVVKVKVLMGGRGSGKTRSIPEDILDRAAELPRARIFLASTTFDSIEENIVPDIREVFELHGLREGIDFVINKKPPAHFVKPFKRIEKWQNSMHLFNGFAVQFISMGREVKKWRGRSFDGGIIDEALNLKGWDVENILFPTLRGLDRWAGNTYWKMLSIYSSYPRTPEGSWFLKFKKLAKKYADRYAWLEATAEDNLAVLGEDYIDEQRATMSYIDFQIEIMNNGDTKDVPLLFYHKYEEETHNYICDDLSDVVIDQPLEISFDFGGRYSCMTVSQENEGHENYVYEFDTNNLTDKQRMSGKTKKVPDIIKDFCKVFDSHEAKTVIIFGERAGLNREAMDDENYYEKITAIFEAQGWEVEVRVEYSDAALHKSRYNFANTCFEEVIIDYPKIRINAATCPNFVTSLNRTRVTDEFKKDKKDERNQYYNQSHAPHLTDTFDYKIYNKYFYLLDGEDFMGGYSGMDGGIDSL